MRVLVCGSRTFDDVTVVASVLSGIDRTYAMGNTRGVNAIANGGAAGADSFASWWADDEGVFFQEYPANWDKHGKAAGPIRNREMYDDSQPDLVVAFVDKPLEDSKGTRDMVGYARKKGCKVWVVECSPS